MPEQPARYRMMAPSKFSKTKPMGIFLAPVLLAMLIGFSFLGLRSGFRLVAAARHRLKTAAIVLTTSIALALLAIVLPFALVASTRVPAFGFLFTILIVVAGVAALAGTLLEELHRKTDRSVYGLAAVALYLAAASLPVTWFWLSERLGEWFRIAWSY